MLKKIVIVGAGLIGGSFSLALKQAGAVATVVGMGRSRAAMQRALELGIVDVVGEDWAPALQGADLVLLAMPVAQTAAVLAALAPHLQDGTVVSDAGSTKGDVVAAARQALGARIRQFVPGHPIAGSESNGPEAARAALFRGKKVVLTPLPENAPEMVERVAAAWRACGAVMHVLTPQQHDEVFASVSHLPHLLAFALVDDIAGKAHADLLFQFAASGFRDFTRIAASSPEMWRDISLANAPALLQELDVYMAQLQGMRRSLAAGDGAALQAVFANAQAARQNWGRLIERFEPQANERGE